MKKRILISLGVIIIILFLASATISVLLAGTDPNNAEMIKENKDLLRIFLGLLSSIAIAFVLIVRLSHLNKNERVLTPPKNIRERLPIAQSSSNLQIFNPILTCKNTVGLDHKPYTFYQFNAIVYDVETMKTYKIENLDFSLGGLKDTVKNLYNFEINSLLN